jgi:hypothetical protein
MTGAAQMLTVRVPLAIRKPRGGRKLILTPSGTTNRSPSAADTTLVKALARAFRWRRMMETGRYGTIDELAAAEKINSSYVSRLLRLTLLAPDIVEAILNGRQSEGITLPGLMEPFPVEWTLQRRACAPGKRANATVCEDGGSAALVPTSEMSLKAPGNLQNGATNRGTAGRIRSAPLEQP